MTDSFIEALAALSPSDGRRVAAFLDKLLHAPDAAGLHPEIVHDAGDRTIRSLKVTHDLRAIGHTEGDEVVLLYVGRHDAAYEWARNRCIECHPVTGELQIVEDPSNAERKLAHSDAAARASHASVQHARRGMFDHHSDDYLLSLGVPPSWMPTIRMVYSEEMLLAVAPDLPSDVGDRLLALATGELVRPVASVDSGDSADAHADDSNDRYRVCTVVDGESLCTVLSEVGIELLADA